MELKENLRALLIVRNVGDTFVTALSHCSLVANKRLQFVVVTVDQPLTESQRKAYHELENIEVIETKYNSSLDISAITKFADNLIQKVKPEIIHFYDILIGSAAEHRCYLTLKNSTSAEIEVYSKRMKQMSSLSNIVMYDNCLNQSITNINITNVGSTVSRLQLTDLPDKMPMIYLSAYSNPYINDVSFVQMIHWPLYQKIQKKSGVIAEEVITFRPSLFEEYLNACAVYINLGLKTSTEHILETVKAAEAGCCLVLADTVENKELWGSSAFYVNVKEPFKAIDKINWIVRESATRRIFSQRAFFKTKQKNSENLQDKLKELYFSNTTDRLHRSNKLMAN